ncbi:uncharacterized protein ACBT44_003980 isoform 1-T1 [Syngnathus typhle]
MCQNVEEEDGVGVSIVKKVCPSKWTKFGEGEKMCQEWDLNPRLHSETRIPVFQLKEDEKHLQDLSRHSRGHNRVFIRMHEEAHKPPQNIFTQALTVNKTNTGRRRHESEKASGVVRVI